MAERAYPEDLAYVNKTKYYDALVERYTFASQFTEGRVVLDIPCGSGWGASKIKNAEYIVGIDNSHEATEYASTHFSNEYITASMDALPLRSDSFDTALVFEGLEHITASQGLAFFNQLKSTVKENGIIVGSVPVLDNDGYSTTNPFHKFEYPEVYLRRLLECNFTVLEYNITKGGDGPVVFFAVRNDKQHMLNLFARSENADGLRKIIDGYINQSPQNRVMMICSTDMDLEYLNDIIGENRLIVIKYDFPPVKTKNRIMGTHIAERLRKANIARFIKRSIRHIWK